MGACATVGMSEDRVSYSMTIEKLGGSWNSTDKFMGNRPTDAESLSMVDNLGGWSMTGQFAELTDAFRTDEKYKTVVDNITTNGGTPLVLAAYAGELEACKILFNNGARLDTLSLHGTSPLWSAAQQNHIDVVEWLLSEGAAPDLINKPQDEDATALHIAALHGRREVCELLIAKGADPHLKKLGNVTTVWLAAQEGHVDVVALLVSQHGVSPTEPRSDGKPPIFIAAQRGHDEVVRYLYNEVRVPLAAVEETGLTPLHAAAMFGHASTCGLLCSLVPIDKRSDFVNAETIDGYTALELRETHALEVDEGVEQVLLSNDAEERKPAKLEEKLLWRGHKGSILPEPIGLGRDEEEEKKEGKEVPPNLTESDDGVVKPDLPTYTTDDNGTVPANYMGGNEHPGFEVPNEEEGQRLVAAAEGSS